MLRRSGEGRRERGREGEKDGMDGRREQGCECEDEERGREAGGREGDDGDEEMKQRAVFKQRWAAATCWREGGRRGGRESTLVPGGGVRWGERVG